MSIKERYLAYAEAFEGDRIVRLQDALDANSEKRIEEWMAARGAKLLGA